MSVFGPIPSLNEYNGFFPRAFASYRQQMIAALTAFWIAVLLEAALLAMGIYFVRQGSRNIRWLRCRSVGIWLIVAAVISSALILPMSYSDIQLWAKEVFQMLA